MSPTPENNNSSSTGATTTPSKTDHVSNAMDTLIHADDLEKLRKLYDTNGNGELGRTEVLQMVHDYNLGRVKDPEILRILRRYDKDGNGHIDLQEVMNLQKEVFAFQESELRYAAYSIGFARAFRYLAFTSDFGEALRPVVHARIVTGTYAVAFAYCIADVGWEAYKLKQNDYYHEKTKEKMTMTQLIVERSTFQAIASLIVPALVIHKSVDIAKGIFAKIGRFQKWGPSVVGLSIIPFLPLYLDEPVEELIEYGFHHYGPWAKPVSAGTDHNKEKHE